MGKELLYRAKHDEEENLEENLIDGSGQVIDFRSKSERKPIG